ncbi:hypothetical protein [Achromobacter sp.]|uniref:hypothetical protein n=1 Tax=Achromobacter sp. TaxID=134375 RepID=UPI0028A827E3|nr:hypothetical protein [Achromobacter sp.]
MPNLSNDRVIESAREAAKIEFMCREDDTAPPPVATAELREGRWVAVMPHGGYTYRVDDEAQAKLFKEVFDAHVADLCGG